MINLIKKDLKLSIKVNIFAVIYALFISATGLIAGNSIAANLLYIIGIVILTFIAVIFTNGYDDKNRSEVVFNSLPLDRRNIVRGKYISLLIFLLISSGAVILFTNILSIFEILDGGDSAGIQSAILAANIVLLFYSIYYPFYFKVGGGLRTFNAVLWIVLMIGPSMLGKGLKALDERGLLDRLMKIDLNTINLYLLVISIVIYYISLQISKRIYMRREF